MDYLARFHAMTLASGRELPPLGEWMRMLAGNFELWPIQRGGEMVGGALFFGQTVHLVITPEWQGRWITPAMRRAYDTWTHPGEVYADIAPDNYVAQRLAKRLGFKFQAPHKTFNRYVKEPANEQAAL